MTPHATDRPQADGSSAERACPFCGGDAFVLKGTRPICEGCGAPPRARVASLICRKIVKPGARVLHFAPEVSLARQLVAVCGSGYEPVDINPPRYAKLAGVATVTRFDMCEDEPKGVYDLIIHNHVLEHVPCDYGAVLRRLHAAIRPGGGQLFSVPMAAPSYREDLDPSLSKEERTRRFGQYDHLRLFAVSDFAERLGVHVGLDAGYRLTDVLSPAELRRAAIPEPWDARWSIYAPKPPAGAQPAATH